MSANRYQKHLLILCEDYATNAMVNGFLSSRHLKNARQVQTLPYLKGWQSVVDSVLNKQLQELARYPERELLLVIDFDKDPARATTIRQHIRAALEKRQLPYEFEQRVHILGALMEAEDLRRALGQSLEEVGQEAAQQCHENRSALWLHDLLKHNQEDVKHLTMAFRRLLF